MGLMDEIKAKADMNNDGKVSKEDLEELRNDDNGSTIDKLKEAADQNDDGRLNFDDVKNFDLGGTVDDLRKSF